MTRMTTLNVPASAWEQAVEGNSNALLATVKLLGQQFFFRAIRVLRDGSSRQVAADSWYDEEIDHLYDLIGPDAPLRTVSIPGYGAGYLVYLHPEEDYSRPQS